MADQDRSPELDALWAELQKHMTFFTELTSATERTLKDLLRDLNKHLNSLQSQINEVDARLRRHVKREEA